MRNGSCYKGRDAKGARGRDRGPTENERDGERAKEERGGGGGGGKRAFAALNPPTQTRDIGNDIKLRRARR